MVFYGAVVLGIVLVLCSSQALVEKKCVLKNANTSIRQHKVLVFVDFKYLEMFLNFLKMYKTACADNVENLEIVCMDDQCHKHLQVYGLICSPHSFTLEFDMNHEKLGVVWTKRLAIMTDYLSEGIDLILSDSDALWVSDPMDEVSKYAQYSDVVASRGWWPWPLYREWGSCLCMGFIYIKANKFNHELFSNVAVELQRQAKQMVLDRVANISNNLITMPDDQWSLNYLLETWNITWLDPDTVTGLHTGNITGTHLTSIRNETTGDFIPYRMQLEKNTVADIGVIHKNNGNHFVTLLPQHNFVRNCHNQSLSFRRRTRKMKSSVSNYTANAIIAHCRLPPGDSRAKKRYMRAFQFWKLQPGEFYVSGLEGYNRSVNYVVNETVLANAPDWDVRVELFDYLDKVGRLHNRTFSSMRREFREQFPTRKTIVASRQDRTKAKRIPRKFE